MKILGRAGFSMRYWRSSRWRFSTAFIMPRYWRKALRHPDPADRAQKGKSIHTVEVLMSIATLGAPIAQLLSTAFGWSHLPANARFTGFCVGMLGDAIFLLSVLCMKDSWRAGIPDKDKTELVTTGIYRFSRNPAFLGFDLMYVSVLLLYGNLLTLCVSAFAIVMLHLQILQEERYLVNTFGAPYQEYCRHVSRYLGRK